MKRIHGIPQRSAQEIHDLAIRGAAVIDDGQVIAVPSTDENRDALARLTLAAMLSGRTCCFCGFAWDNRADVALREPIVASAGGNDLACQPCWDDGKRL